MKNVLLLSLIVSVFSNTSTFKEEWERSEYAKKILKQQQTVLRNTRSKHDLMNQLIGAENDLANKVEAHMKSYQDQQTTNIEKKQHIKQQIFLVKYRMQDIEQELRLLEKEQILSKGYLDLYKQQTSDFSKLIPQLIAFRNDEDERTEQQRPDLDVAKYYLEIFQKVFEEITELAQKLIQDEYEIEFKQNLNGQKYLDKKKGFLVQTHNEEKKKLMDMAYQSERFLQQQVKKFTPNNPFGKILTGIIKVLSSENPQTLIKIPHLLDIIDQEIDSTIRNLDLVQKERQGYYNDKRSLFKQELDVWNEELSQVEPVYKQSLENIQKLQAELDSLKNKLITLQANLEDMEKQIKAFQEKYAMECLQNMENLKIARQIKMAMFEDLDDYETFLRGQTYNT